MGFRQSLVMLACLVLVGCSAMEQYHKPVGLEELPSDVVVTLSRNYPNVTISSYEKQVMFDGTVRYAVAVTDKSKVESVVIIKTDGTELK